MEQPSLKDMDVPKHAGLQESSKDLGTTLSCRTLFKTQHIFSKASLQRFSQAYCLYICDTYPNLYFWSSSRRGDATLTELDFYFIACLGKQNNEFV